MSNFKELVRVGRDAEARYTQAGKLVIGFSAAFDNGWGDRKQTVWLDCSAWGDRWEKVAPYLTKGAQIVVAGNIGTREYDGKTYITLDVSDIKLTARSDSQQQPQPRPAPQQHRQSQQAQQAPGGAWLDDMDQDVPF